MFDLKQHIDQCEVYLGRSLAAPVKILRASQLAQSTRTAPWRLDVAVNGQEQAFVLQLDPRGLEYEYQVLKALEPLAIPTPRAFGLDVTGEALGVPCFFSDFIDGESLLKPMVAGETWAEEIYLEAVCALQSVSPTDLGEVFTSIKQESADDFLEDAWAYFKDHPHPLARALYQELSSSIPEFPAWRFSNGDLWLENFIVQNKKLAGIIDFQGAAFSDPVYEFLLSFFVEPGLQNRGTEATYCQRIGVNPIVLHWYHGLEFFDTWRWVLSSGKDFGHHTAESLETSIKNWLQYDPAPWAQPG